MCKGKAPEGGAASSDEKARKAAALMKNGELIELKSNHDIHRFQPEVFIEVFYKLERLHKEIQKFDVPLILLIWYN